MFFDENLLLPLISTDPFHEFAPVERTYSIHFDIALVIIIWCCQVQVEKTKYMIQMELNSKYTSPFIEIIPQPRFILSRL